ncbi:MAG: sigma-70 family RNA polymerase sigma factor [Bacteroidales bacterium]|nr:sigma-70 family RNA polymerase sigma factor [Bacteroidales bacterium]MBR0533555.1 sigma-70 family RNA polymerase sigma factor [Bacteroidales bacterium]MBR7025980.1 sigma-70 family RNA polymerase sigma factor [Bacteroidales bacterium]
MLSLCQRYMKDREVAKDVLQDGFVTLFEKISTYKNEGSFEGWARKIFVNTALMQLRRNDALKFSDNIEDSQAMQMVQSNTLEKIGADEIYRLVSSMPDGFRTVFNLYVIEGYSHDEIADMLSITVGGSRSQLSRARAWLQSKIKTNEKYD